MCLVVVSLCLICCMYVEFLEYVCSVFLKFGNFLALFLHTFFVSPSFSNSNDIIFRLPLIFSQVLDDLFLFCFALFAVFISSILWYFLQFNLLLIPSGYFFEILHFSCLEKHFILLKIIFFFVPLKKFSNRFIIFWSLCL